MIDLVIAEPTNIQKYLYEEFLGLFPGHCRDLVNKRMLLSSNVLLQYTESGVVYEWIAIYCGGKDNIYKELMKWYLGSNKRYYISTNFIYAGNRTLYSHRYRTVQDYINHNYYNIEMCYFNSSNQYYSGHYLNGITKKWLELIPRKTVFPSFDILLRFFVFNLNGTSSISDTYKIFMSSIIRNSKIDENIFKSDYSKTLWFSSYCTNFSTFISKIRPIRGIYVPS